MKRLFSTIAAILIGVAVSSLPAAAQNLGSFNGQCQLGGVNAIFQGIPSTNTLLGSYPQCTVSVYFTGTTTLVPANQIFADNNVSPTPLGNPFTANLDGSILFFAASQTGYDIATSAGIPISMPTTFTYTDVVLCNTNCGATGGGGGGNLTGSGTPGTVALWTGTTALGNSHVTDSASLLSFSGNQFQTGSASGNNINVWSCPVCSQLNLQVPTTGGKAGASISLQTWLGNNGQLALRSGGTTFTGQELDINNNGTITTVGYPQSTFANLTAGFVGTASMVYCTDCSAAVPQQVCTTNGGTGSGTFAFRIGPAQWWCLATGGGGSGGSGTVTSVGLTQTGTVFTITGSPVTIAGNLNLAFASEAANTFLAAPSGASGVPTFRSIVSADVPPINLSASGNGGVVGNLGVGNLNSGVGASSSTVWCGNGTWCTPSGTSITVNSGSALGSPVNFQNGAAVNGVAINMSNPSSSNIQAALTGTLNNAGLTNSSITVSTPVAGGLIGGAVTNLGGTVTLNLTNTCSNGQGLTWNGASWVCTTLGAGSITGATAGGGLVATGSTLGLLLTCSNGQVLQWNGATWACATVSGTGTVTHTLGALTLNAMLAGNGSADIKVADASGVTYALGAITTDINPFALSWTNNAPGVTLNGVNWILTDTASHSGSQTFQINGGTVGTTPLFQLFNTGALLLANGQVTATGFASNGTGAGQYVCTQGSAPGSLAANSILFALCPNVVTASYSLLLPGTGPAAAGPIEAGAVAGGTLNASTLVYGTKSGNTSKYATISGSLVSGDQIKADASGNLIDAGGPPFVNPMTTVADIIIGGASGAATRLAAPTSTNGVTQYLTSTPLGGVGGSEVWKPDTFGSRASACPFNADTVSVLDRKGLLTETDSTAQCVVTLPQAGSAGFASNFWFVLKCVGTQDCLLVPTTSTIDGGANVDTLPGGARIVFTDATGSNYQSVLIAPQFGGVSFHSSSYTLTALDHQHAVIMNCAVACVATLPNPPPFPGWTVWLASNGVTTATVSLNGLGFNSSSSIPALNPFVSIQIRTDGTNFFGDAPLVAGSNITITGASNGLTIATAGGGSGSVTSVGLTVNSTSPSGIFTVTGSPVTTTGNLNFNLLGTSGGIPYFSSTTVLSSSGILNTNVLTRGGGAGAAPTNSDLIESSNVLANVTSTQSQIYQGGADVSANSAGGAGTFRGANQTGTGGSGSKGGAALLAGGSNAATNTSSAGGSVEIVAGGSTGASSTGLQGLALFVESYAQSGTVTQWNLECFTATAKAVTDCSATPQNIAGVALAKSGSVQVNVATGESEIAINASAAVTLGHSVCAGTTAGQITDSGGTSGCPAGQYLVGWVIATSGTWPAFPDGTAFPSLTTTLPLIRLNTVGTSSLPAQYSKLRCETGLGDGLNAMTAGTYLQSTCYNDSGVTWTITGIKCFTDNNGTSTLNAAGNVLGALLTGAVTCTNSWAAGTQSANVALTSGDYIKFTFVADGTSKQTGWLVSMTQ